MPAHLRRAGYATGLVGKWNLKSDARIWFDEVYSLMDWGAGFFRDDNGVYPGVWQRWPGVLEARQVYDQPVSTLDVYPTFAAAAEAPRRRLAALAGILC